MRMSNIIRGIFTIVVFWSIAFSQLIVHQQNMTLEVPPNPEMEIREIALKYLNMDIEALKLAGIVQYQDQSTAYFRQNDFAFESTSPEEGKITVVADAGSGMMHTIMWQQKLVLKMNAADVSQMQKKTEDMMNQMMQNLSPEMQEQLKQYQNQAKTGKPEKPKVVATGKKKKIGEWMCEQYLVEKPGEFEVIWAAEDREGLRKRLEDLAQKIDKMMPDEEEESGVKWDEFDLIPGKLPVETRRFHFSPYSGSADMEIETITGIERRDPPAEIFKVPGKAQGFKVQNMQEMMQEMMKNMPQDY